MTKSEITYKRLRSGSCFEVYLFKILNKYYVFKYFNNTEMNQKLALILIKDFKEIRKEAEKSKLNVPRLYDVGYLEFNSSKIFYIIEEFVGISIRDLIDAGFNTHVLYKLIKLTNKEIKKIPETMPYDCNPGNFVINPNGKFYLIDFMPSYPWRYKRGSSIANKFEKIFVTYKINHFDEPKIDSYYKSEPRINRFNYYLTKITQNIHIKQ